MRNHWVSNHSKFIMYHYSLSGQNMYDCGYCKDKTEAKKETLLSNLPLVLAIHLKRFSYEKSGRKILSHVSCPMNLRVKEYSTEDCPANDTNYELFAMILHRGNITSGHYVALIRLTTETMDSVKKKNFETIWFGI